MQGKPTGVATRIFTYLRTSMTEKRLSNWVFQHAHKQLVDETDLVSIAKTFASLNNERMRYFGTFI